jgi:hypothetical protein
MRPAATGPYEPWSAMWWPKSLPRRAPVGVGEPQLCCHAVHALRLRLRGQAIGALNLFDREPGTLPDSDLALGQALADMATIGILQERAILAPAHSQQPCRPVGRDHGVRERLSRIGDVAAVSYHGAS